MVGYEQVIQGLQEERVPGGDASLAEYIDTARPAAQVVTDAAILSHAIDLTSFKILIDWNGDLTTPGLPAILTRELRQFKTRGGIIIPAPLNNDGAPTPARPVPSAFTVNPASQQIETWIAINGGHAWVTIANGEEDLPILDTLTGGSRVTLGNVNSYSGTITVNPASGITSRPLTYNESMASATIIEQDVSASRNSG